MNPRKNPTCVSSQGPDFSTTSGTDIDGYIINVARMLRQKTKARSLFLYGQLHGRRVKTSEEATKLGLEYGVLHYYGRNVCQFVMSRAARKRGYTTNDGMYNRACERFH